MSKAENLTGQTFGVLKVLAPVISKDGYACWRCICTCGNIIEVRHSDLVTGNVTSCGCLPTEKVGYKHNLVGQTFGQLTVIEPAPPRGNHKYWKCRCECGTIKDIAQDSLVYGNSKSCGCSHGTQSNLVGQVFGYLTVLEQLTIGGKTYCRCKCICGNIKDIGKYNLLTGNTKSCGCKNPSYSNSKSKDLVGQTFGRLTVIEPAPPRGNHKYWRCKCTCGTIKDITQSNLISGNTKSCGCLKHKSNLVGQTFGKLTVIAPAPTRRNNTYWKCRCACGTVKDIEQNSLFSGNTKSCGCLKHKHNLVGQTFGILTVIAPAPSKNKHTYWKCQCMCGTIKDIAQYNLLRGHTKSCGCLRHKENEMSVYI